MDHPAAKVRFPEPIRQSTIDFFKWYINEIHIHEPPFHHRQHAENAEFKYDWRPSKGRSRLALTHLATGLIAVNGFDFIRIKDTDPRTLPPPPSLLIATWLDLCSALDWIGEGERAILDDQLSETIAADAARFGEPLYR